MADISPHFDIVNDHAACRCGCGHLIIVPALVYALEAIRVHFGAPINVTCWCRCEDHNAAVGGVKNSQHLSGRAADIKVQGISPGHVADYCEKLIRNRGGVGRYKTFTHLDVRGNLARWDYT